PAHFIHLLHFPLTSNGKVDRSKLPELQQGAHAVPQRYAAPENKVQEKLALMWSEILEKNQICIRDNFFELGGHSLKTIQLFAKIHKEFNVRIEIQKMFKYPTIEQLAKVIKESGSETIGTITPVAPSAHYNLSNAQRRLWILHQLDKKQTAYNIIRSLYIDGNLDLKVFENAARKVINRHESLRTTFIEVNGEPRQQIADSSETDFRVAYLDFRNISDSEQAAAEEAAKEVSTAFDLATGPLLRIKMLHLSNQRYWMILSVHHIVSDGWSMEVMFNEILSCYLSNPEDHRKLATLSIQYKDFAEWQHDQLTKDAFMHHKKYWKTQLDGNLPILNLPSDLKRPAVKTFYGGTHIFAINPALIEPIKQITQTHEVTLFMVLLAGIKAMLFKYTGDTDILVGSPVAGRQHPDLENQIGFFVNTLPLRSRFRGHDKFSDLLLTVKEVTLNAFEH
ncbi:MAG: non-ribosomal peptide synthetase, partial [Azospira oryzae]